MHLKKTTERREPSHTPHFFWTAIVVLLAVVLMIIVANFVALKALFLIE